ncbi:MAG: DUF1080 domain-containing protein [Candidatus Hydrogenedentes bacterium]|nr:DUF1080 domain-containing protein [Candidatus Hydrogenedentota bacterium]
MRTIALFLIAGAIVLPAVAQRSAEEAFPTQVEPFTGEYVGTWSEDEDVDPKVAAQVFPTGRDEYTIRVVSKLDMRCPPKLIVQVKQEGDTLKFEEQGFYGEVKPDGTFTGGKGRGRTTFEMKKVTRESPTMGAKAPEGAIVLFDGGNLDAWQNPKGWEIVDGAMMVTPDAEDLKTKQSFKDAKLHVEFRTSYLPTFSGQQRSNSGVFLQDTYEVQVLDTFGLEGYYDECGGLYKVAAPQVNACRPPLQWQTYDIEFHAAKYDDSGKLLADPWMSVDHNGVRIHHEQPMPWITAWKEEESNQPHPKEAGPIRLQAHHNYVQYRNIWIENLSK